MEDVLKHPFFYNLKGDTKDNTSKRAESKLDSMQKEMAKLPGAVAKEVSSNLAVLTAEVEKSVRLLKANVRMMTEMVEGTQQVPGLMVFLPTEDKLSSWVQQLKDPQQA
eukprot:scaffold12132_cov20-Prasinocladus_malaysianus.AAC.1